MAFAFIPRDEGTKPAVSFERLSHYNAGKNLNLGLRRDTNYWAKALLDDAGSFTININLSKPAVGNETITWTTEDPDNTEGSLWSTTQDRNIALTNGQTQVQIPLDIVKQHKWFRQRDCRFELLSGNNLYISDSWNRARIQFEPSSDVPEISITTNGGTVTNPGDTVDVNFSITTGCLDDVSIYWAATGALTGFVSGPTQGDIAISGGSTSRTVAFTYNGGGSTNDTIGIKPDHPIGVVKYVTNSFNEATQKFDRPLPVYQDQNLWTYGNHIRDGLQEVIANGPPWPFLPGYPTNLASGGVSISDAGHYADIAYPSGNDPFLDPYTGLPVPWITPHPGVPGFPYIRQQFDISLCEATSTQLHNYRPWVRGAYSIAHQTGIDRHVVTEFHRIGCRIRTQNRNHGIVIRNDILGATGNYNNTKSSATGLGRNFYTGETKVWGPFSDGVRYWEWKQYIGHPTDFQWGMDETDDGIRFWFIHHVETGAVYDQGNDVFGNPSTTETPLVDEGNPIYYPTWFSSDGSNYEGLTTFKDNRRGTPIYNIWFEHSDSPLTGAPARYWPNEYQAYTPRGLAHMITGSEGNHLFSRT